jgi:hypothetical protein
VAFATPLPKALCVLLCGITMSSMSHPTIVAGFLFVIGLCAESWFSWRFLHRLKHQHEKLWAEMGFRTIWTDAGLISAYGTIKYLKDRSYSGHDNANDIKFCEAYRMPMLITYWLAWAGLALFFISIFVFGGPQS